MAKLLGETDFQTFKSKNVPRILTLTSDIPGEACCVFCKKAKEVVEKQLTELLCEVHQNPDMDDNDKLMAMFVGTGIESEICPHCHGYICTLCISELAEEPCKGCGCGVDSKLITAPVDFVAACADHRFDERCGLTVVKSIFNKTKDWCYRSKMPLVTSAYIRLAAWQRLDTMGDADAKAVTSEEIEQLKQMVQRIEQAVVLERLVEFGSETDRQWSEWRNQLFASS